MQHQIIHPFNGWRNAADRPPFFRLESGLEIGDDKPTSPAKAVLTEDGDLLLTIHEGRFHQVKRMLQAIGNQVLTLERIRFGSLSLDPALSRGDYRALTEEEIKHLRIKE